MLGDGEMLADGETERLTLDEILELTEDDAEIEALGLVELLGELP